jgi:hypothetical protein
LRQGLDAIRASRHKDRMVLFAQHQLSQRRARLSASAPHSSWKPT